jgi:hypothetical protein
MNEILSHIEEILEAKKVFERKRKDNKSRALVILLYRMGFPSKNVRIVFLIDSD